MTFHEALLKTRKSRGLSQEELAEQLGVSRQAVSKWETGEASPDLNKLLALSKALDISLDALCGLQEDAPATASAPPSTPRRRHSPAALLFVLLLLIAAFAAGCILGRSIPPHPTDVSVSSVELPEIISVTGLSFSPEPDGVTYQFTPSFIDESCTYQITFAATGETPVVCDTVPVGGVCTGSAVLPPWGGYHVTVSISNGETTRAVSVACNLSYTPSANGENGVRGGGSVSWSPAD